MRELSAQLTEGEKIPDSHFSGASFLTAVYLSLRQNLRFCHLPHQREACGAQQKIQPVKIRRCP